MIRANFNWPHIVDYRVGQKFLYVTFPAGTVTIVVSPLMSDPPVEILECAVKDLYHDHVPADKLPVLKGMRW